MLTMLVRSALVDGPSALQALFQEANVLRPRGQFWFDRICRSTGNTALLQISELSRRASLWAAQQELGSDRALVVYDHLGVGESARTIATSTIETMTLGALGVAEGMSFEVIDVFGQRAGGRIVQVIPWHQPQRLNKGFSC